MTHDIIMTGLSMSRNRTDAQPPKNKFYDSGEEWQKFREAQADRFGMSVQLFSDFFKTYPKQTRNSLIDKDRILGQILTGKPEIAAFMGITVKTVRTWINKYPSLPIQTGLPSWKALSDRLLLWKIDQTISRLPEGLIITIICQQMGITPRILREKYLPKHSKRVVFKNYPKKKLDDALFLLLTRSIIKDSLSGL